MRRAIIAALCTALVVTGLAGATHESFEYDPPAESGTVPYDAPAETVTTPNGIVVTVNPGSVNVPYTHDPAPRLVNIPHEEGPPPIVTRTSIAAYQGKAGVQLPNTSYGTTVSGLNLTALDRDIADAKAANADFVRTDINFTGSWQPVAEFIIKRALAQGLAVSAVIGSTWRDTEGPGGNTGPGQLMALESYFPECQKIAQMFAAGSRIVFEIGNEPDINGVSPEEYTPRMKECYRGIRSVSSVFPALTAGFFNWNRHNGWDLPNGGNDGDLGIAHYVKRIYELGGRGSFDGVSVHFYDVVPTTEPNRSADWNVIAQTFVRNPNIRALMDANGDSEKPITLSETGSGIGAQSANETEQEADCQGIFTHNLSYPWAGFSWYLLRVPTGHTGYGLIRPDHSKRPAYTCYQNRAAGF